MPPQVKLRLGPALQSAYTKLGVDNRVQAGVLADRACLELC